MLSHWLLNIIPHAWWMQFKKALSPNAPADTPPSAAPNASEAPTDLPLTAQEKALKRKLHPETQLYFFGSFNPVHIGHLSMAREALSHFHTQGFRELVFIPTPHPPNKAQELQSERYTLYGIEKRLKLIELAIRDWGAQSFFKALPLEQALPDGVPNYTALTLRRYFADALTARKSLRLHLVMGEETFLSLPSWRDFAWLRRHVHFIVLPRPSHRGDAAPFHEAVQNSELGRYAELMHYTYLRKVRPVAVDASQLREAPHRHAAWVTPGVFQVLYGKGKATGHAEDAGCDGPVWKAKDFLAKRVRGD